MPRGDKYKRLKVFLQNCGEMQIKLSFDDIERILGFRLPKSATQHAESWWSNNIDHSQAISWLDAGYETDYVTDTYQLKHIIFVKRS